MNQKIRRPVLALLAALTFGGCAMNSQAPIKTMPQVDLERFMGPWYVIASIPTFIEKDAYNAVESYAMNEDGTIATTFTFNRGSFDGEPKKYTPKGFVKDRKSNAVWGMRFVWPFKADYRIVHLDEGYTETIIGRKQRDFVWIMARKPKMSDADYERLLKMVGEQGYDVSKVKKVPQQER